MEFMIPICHEFFIHSPSCIAVFVHGIRSLEVERSMMARKLKLIVKAFLAFPQHFLLLLLRISLHYPTVHPNYCTLKLRYLSSVCFN